MMIVRQFIMNNCGKNMIKKISANRTLEEKRGYVIIKSENDDEKIIPAICDICSGLLRNIDDELSYKKFQCCDDCSQDFARPNIIRWESGWRPTELEIKNAISKRQNIFINIC